MMRREERGARSEWRVRFYAALCGLAFIGSTASAAPFSFDDITYWVGTGTNRAAIVLDWTDNSTNPPALAWGFRWDGSANGATMLKAIVASDPRLYAKLGGTMANPTSVYGLGYDANYDGQFAIDDGTNFDSQGFAFASPADLAESTDPADYYAEGWFTGVWHYSFAPANPYDGGTWNSSQLGMASRTLADGAWDSWAFTPTFNFAATAQNPLAAPPPFVPGDFNHDGQVTPADYADWRATFGSTTVLDADANDNNIVDTADYIVWRRNLTSGGGQVIGTAIPEPAGICFAVIVAMAVLHSRVLRARRSNRETQ